MTGNRITGASGGVAGVRTVGFVTGTTVEGNSISGLTHGVLADNNAGGEQSGTAVHFNRIVGNATAGLQNNGTTAIDAIDNWWGCNEGPGQTGCDAVVGPADADPWLVLGVSASPASIKVGGETSEILASLTRNSDGATPSGNVFPDGDPVAFSTSLGTITPANDPLDDAEAESELTSGSQSGTATVSAALDGETATTPVAIQPECANSGGDLDGDGTTDVCDADDDGDGLNDTTETQIGTDPRNANSDGDAVADGSDACPTVSGTQSNGCPQTATADDAPPTVSLTAPATGTSLSKGASATITAQASDDKAVTSVQFFAGDRLVCTDTAAPYECDYQPTGADVGRVLLLAVATDAASQVAVDRRAITVGRFIPTGLTSATTPARDRKLPYVFTTTGQLRLPAGVTAQQGCRGQVTVQIKAGKRTISTREASLDSNCRYRSRVRFSVKRRLAPTLRVRARFPGNNVLGSRVAPVKTVKVG